MIDIEHEKIVSFSDAPSHIPGRPHIATVHRFNQRGSHGVKLESVKVGGRRFTSVEAIQRFVDAVTAAADGTSAPRPESSAARDRRLAKVEAELEAAGV